jgi:hypothetical protein
MQRAATFLVSLFLLLRLPIMAAEKNPAQPGMAQVPTWSRDDLNFFLHGSMGTEIFPEPVLRTFIKIYPELFPTSNLAKAFRNAM